MCCCLGGCRCVCRLTLGLLALAWGLPANAGAMLIQVEESHQPFGSCLQLHHLCPGLHDTHASLHCRRKNRYKHGGSVEHYIRTQREQVPAFICLCRKQGEVPQCHTIGRTADVGQSPKLPQRCYCVNTQGCLSVTQWPSAESNSEREETRSDLMRGDRADACLLFVSLL